MTPRLKLGLEGGVNTSNSKETALSTEKAPVEQFYEGKEDSCGSFYPGQMVKKFGNTGGFCVPLFAGKRLTLCS